MTRAALKSLLIILVAFSIFIAIGWLQETIDRSELEIDRLYATTYVFGQVLPGEPYTLIRRDLGSGYITTALVESLEASGLVFDVYYEAAMPWAFGIDPEMSLGEAVDELLMDAFDITIQREEQDEEIPFRFFHIVISEGQVMKGPRGDGDYPAEILHQVTAISSVDLFTQRSISNTGILDVELALSLEVEFAPGLNEAAFVYEDVQLEKPIPVIVSEEMMNRNDFVFGDLIAIYYFDLTNFSTGTMADSYHDGVVVIEETWERVVGEIIGVYDNHHTTMQETIFLPLSAWQSVMGADLYLTTLEFLVDPVLNRIDAHEAIENAIGSELSGYILDIHDSELRFTVQTMEENVALLWLLYPVVVIISLMIAAAASLFLTLQNTKNVAMMRVLGVTRKKAGLILWVEQIILSLIGLTVGLVLLSALGWGFHILALFEVAILYLASAMIGSIIGIIMIVRQAPLELLQARE